MYVCACVVFLRNIIARSRKSNTQSDTKKGAHMKHACTCRHLKWCNKPHSDTHSCAPTQTFCKRSQTLTPTLMLCKLPQNSAELLFSSSTLSLISARSVLLSSSFYFLFFLFSFTKFKLIKCNDIGDSILHSLLINQVR